MNKKLIFSISLVLIVFFAVFVSASQIETGAAIYKGWNLIYGFPEPSVLSGGFDASNIKYIYVFIPNIQEYARVYPNPENDKINQIGDGYLIQTPMWVYSTSETDVNFNGIYNAVEYQTQEHLPLGELTLFGGWNFVAITPYMIGKKLGDMKGNCNIERLYFWDSQKQEWYSENLLTKTIPNDIVNLGLVMKVSNNCNLGGQGSGLGLPPGLPDSDDNPQDTTTISDEYLIKKDISQLKYVKYKEMPDFNRNNCELGEGGVDLPGNCRTFMAAYSYDNSKYAVMVEEHDVDGFTNENFVSAVDSFAARNGLRSEVAEINRNKFYAFSKASLGNVGGVWYSGNKIVFIESEGGVSNDGAIGALFNAYSNKYPSSLNIPVTVREIPVKKEYSFPEKIGEYALVDASLSGPNAEYECRNVEDHPDTKNLGLNGEICIKGVRLQYENKATKKGLFVIPTSVSKGLEIYLALISKMSKPVIIDGKRLFRVEEHEIGWVTQGKEAVNIIMTQEYTVIDSGDGDGRSYNYGTATGDNPVTKYFLENYPPKKLTQNTVPSASIDSVSELYGGSIGSSFNGIIRTSESDGTYPEPTEGFNIQVYMFSENPRQTAFGANAQYKGNGEWSVVGKYPNRAGNYEVSISLYCARDDAKCSSVYGTRPQYQVQNKHIITLN